MHPLEVAAGMDVRKIREKYGKGVPFIGGIDKRALTTDYKTIEKEVIPKVKYILDTGGGWTVECDHGVVPDISFGNYCYFRQLVPKLYES